MIHVVKLWPINPVSAELALPCHFHGQKNIIESELICWQSKFIEGVLARLCGTPPKRLESVVWTRLTPLHVVRRSI